MSIQATVKFHELIQDTHDTASDDDPNQKNMLSRAFFTLDVGDDHYSDMSVVLRQPFGTDYETEPIEAERPVGSYKGGNWNHNEFREAVEDYYRSAVGSRGRMINVGPGVRMRNNKFVFSKSYKLEIPD